MHPGVELQRQAAPRRRFLIPFALVSLAACKTKRVEPSRDAEVDAAPLPETVTVVLDAGPARPRTVMLLSGLPRPCQDRALGTVTFTQEGDNVLITSSKTRARATCTRVDEHKLSCDWVGPDGRATVQHGVVTYGPNTKIGGPYDKGRAFSCPIQR